MDARARGSELIEIRIVIVIVIEARMLGSHAGR